MLDEDWGHRVAGGVHEHKHGLVQLVNRGTGCSAMARISGGSSGHGAGQCQGKDRAGPSPKLQML